MFSPFALPDSEPDFYYGPPRETFYSRTPTYQTRHKDVEHLIDAGRLFHVFGDWEATDKDRETAQPWQGGFLIFDVSMRLVGRLSMRMALARIHQMAVQAALVSRVDPESLDKGWAGYIGMGMYHDFLRSASKINGKALELEEHAFDDGTEGHIYPLYFPDTGRIELEINAAGNQFRPVGSARPSKSRWGHKIYRDTHWYNGDGYDNYLASHVSARYNFPHLFEVTRRSHASIHIDPLALARWMWAFGPQGKYGLQLPPRYHHKTRRDVLSVRLSDITQANSSAAYRALGREGGLRLWDGREYDPELAHGALPDAESAAALYVLLRQTDPDGVRFVEMMANEHTQKKFLQGNSRFGDRPLVGFVHYDEGMLSRGIGCLLETGDVHGQLSKNKVLLFNLSEHDPAAISKLSDSDLRAKLVQKHNRILIEMRTNRTAHFADFERAALAGTGGHLTKDEYDQRRKWLIDHRHTIFRIATTQEELTNPPRPPNITTTRRTQEDSYVRYGDLERVRIKDETSGVWLKEPDDIYRRFEKKWNIIRSFDTCLKELMAPHAVEYSDNPSALTDYRERFDKFSKKLKDAQKKWAHPLVLPDTSLPTTNAEAVRHVWALRLFLYDKLFDYLPERFIQNERGQNLTIVDAMKVPYALRKDLLKDEDYASDAYWKLIFERDEKLSAHRLIDMMFEADAFYQKHPSAEMRACWAEFSTPILEQCRKHYEAKVTLGVQGPPNISPADHMPMTAARRMEEINRIEHTAAAGAGFEYERFVAGIPEGPQILANLKAGTQRVLQENPWSDEKKTLMGIDPQTDFPFHNPLFSVPRDRVIRLEVPDCMLENLQVHNQWGRHLVLTDPGSDVFRALENMKAAGQELLLVGKATGVTRLAAKAFVAPMPDTVDARDDMGKAASAYATIGGKLGQHPFLLTFEQLWPVHGERPVDEKVQAVPLLSPNWVALADARAGSLPKPMECLTKLIIRNTGRELTTGKIRLRRCLTHENGSETGDEYEAIVAKATHTTVDSLTSLSDAEAQKFGQPIAADLVARWRRVFANLNIRKPDEQKVWVLELAKPVDKASYTFFKRDELPTACFAPGRPDFDPDIPNPHFHREAA
jgi:hypothetical protein